MDVRPTLEKQHRCEATEWCANSKSARNRRTRLQYLCKSECYKKKQLLHTWKIKVHGRRTHVPTRCRSERGLEMTGGSEDGNIVPLINPIRAKSSRQHVGFMIWQKLKLDRIETVNWLCVKSKWIHTLEFKLNSLGGCGHGWVTSSFLLTVPANPHAWQSHRGGETLGGSQH